MRKITSIFIMALLAGCSKGATSATEFDRGGFNDREYRNDSIGFSLQVPESWHIENIGLNEFAEFDAALDEFMAGYEEEQRIGGGDSMVYFGLFSSILPTTETFPASLTAYLVDLSGLRGVDGATGYLRHFEGRFPQSIGIQVGDIVSGELGGRQFAAISTNASGVRRMEYATRVGNYALVFSIVYETDDQLSEVRRVLNEIRFERDS